MRALRCLVVFYAIVWVAAARNGDSSLEVIVLAFRGLVSGLFFISILISVIQLYASGGDDRQISAAKNRIKNAIIAYFVIMALSYVSEFAVSGGT